MTITRRGLLAAMTATLGLAIGHRALAADPAPYGTWTAVIDPGKVQQTFRLVVDATGAVLHLNSLDQGAASFPANEVAIDGERLRLTFARLNLKIEGALTDPDHLNATMSQGEPLTLRFTRGQTPDSLSAPIWPPLTADLLEAKRAAAGAPGIGAAWARGITSTIVVAGSRSSEARAPVRSEDQWHWGSITKSMTATLCARLVEAGVLSWDMKVGEVLAGEVAQEAYRDATLLHLLSHRAGLHANIADADMKAFSYALQDARAERRRYAQLALAQKPAGPLGAHAYSNNGYVVVGAMIETLAGKPWESLIQTEVFAPLGVRRAGQGAPGVRGFIEQPVGHLVEDGKRTPRQPGQDDDDNVVASGPAGRVHMPMADMLTYLSAHRDRPAAFLKAASWEKLHTPPFGGNDALGWFTGEGGRLFHGGSNTLWQGEVLVDPTARFVCAACANDAAPETQRAVGEMLLSARAAALA